MKTKSLWRAALAGAAMVLGGGLVLGGQPPAAKPTGPAPKAVPGRPAEAAPAGDNASALRCFELTNADPEEVRGILAQVGGTLIKGGPRPVPGATAPNSLRMAVDARTHTLFVRGTEKELEAVADLVAVLDADPSKPAPEGKSARVIRLRHAKVPEVMQVLTGLGYQGQILPLPRTGTLLLTGPEAESKEVRSVIEKLDVEHKAGAKPAVKKPVVRDGD
jgi:hypothetical protein